MKTAISVPDPLFKEAERLARKLGISRSRLYSKALAVMVGSMKAEDITAALNEVYSHEPSEADPILSAMQMATLKREDWSCSAARSGGRISLPPLGPAPSTGAPSSSCDRSPSIGVASERLSS